MIALQASALTWEVRRTLSVAVALCGALPKPLANDCLLQLTKWCSAKLAVHGQVAENWLGFYGGMVCYRRDCRAVL
jgi:hypothetical protein